MKLKRALLCRIGSYLHEASVLIGVLGLLEKVITNQPIGIFYAVGIIFVSFIFFLVGYLLEVDP
jgi:hypothetical protein